ncbi:sensor histidine kinase [Miltoncostaea oceani]|uniref:sensor histidine kinase n=1 Tax=Miltoncostaea oceani TaxID=2843216 RepID=UPI001C3C36B3|nr:HAMP domain-containing sensor histidine kinase [Miltoncostaea oceani]
MSLRARLLAVVLALMVVALVAAGWATHVALRSFLIDRVDRDLREAPFPAAVGFGPGPAGPGPGSRVDPGLPPGAIVEIRAADGTVLVRRDVRESGQSARTLPAAVPSGYSTVEVAGGGEYRVLSRGEGDGGGFPRRDALLPTGGALLVGIPLSDVNDTLRRLLLIEIAVGVVTLAGLTLLALWLVRLGLRPLERMGTTADAIAAGDLSRRVDDDDPRTEVGRLGRTLNAMLGRIEESFDERRASEERLRRFVADASHELQTPLTSVRGYAELFRRGGADDPEDLQTIMRRIEAEAARMGVLVDDLLLLARLDQGRPLDLRPLDLAEIAGELAADARVVEPGRPITVRDDGPVMVRGDDLRLRQVVGNLLSNARAHTPPGAAVTVTTTARDGEAVVEVADTGPGLAPEHAARVFERFFRADPSRARTSGGSGLGLSIVAAIAEAHGGRAEVTSAPGEGAAFRLVLPLADAAEDGDPVPAPPPPPSP